MSCMIKESAKDNLINFHLCLVSPCQCSIGTYWKSIFLFDLSDKALIFMFILRFWYVAYHYYVVGCRSPWSCPWSILHSGLCLCPESPDVQLEMCCWGKLFVKVDFCKDWSTGVWGWGTGERGFQLCLSVIHRALHHNNHISVCGWGLHSGSYELR